MTDGADHLAERVAEQSDGEFGPFRFCKVISVVANTSATIDYSGTPVTIPKAQMFCAAFPAANDWVVVGVNGSDRFILGRRLP